MDDEALYGTEIYHLGFGEAVDRNLLSDYKVLVLTVNRKAISPEMQSELADGKREIETDDVTKLVGCLQALSKNMDYDGKFLRKTDPGLMRKGVAFCQTIAKSKQITEVFNQLSRKFGPELSRQYGLDLVDVASQHIDGGMGAATRDAKMEWLKRRPENENECRLLCNVRCLSEGVDVPTLDAVMFLSAKNSEIEVVQSVGRVMRKAEGKKFGYIIIPVLVPSYENPEDTLDDNERYKVVWTVLNALKSHDDRFTQKVNQIHFNVTKPDGGGSILIGGIAHGDAAEIGHGDPGQPKADILKAVRENEHNLYNAIYAKLVTKVGSRQDLLQWAQDVAKIAEGFKKRITEVVKQNGPHKDEFEKFLEGLRETLNPSVDANEAIEMLSQHLISQPVFEAIFNDYSFVKNNPVSQSLEAMIDVLEDQGLDKDRVVLNRFYKTVKQQVSGIDNAEGRQKIIVKLYDNFFRQATPKAVEKLGIVYTPIEIVDFIINSVSEVLKKEFNRNISDENIHILDPFTGTGTFITRLIQSGLLGKSLKRKYGTEIHANEIVLLAYYIASVNIENAYHAAMGEDTVYKPFDGICLTDSFQLYEMDHHGDLPELKLQKNIERINTQKKSPIQIILGNPPYSVGQRSANDNAQNQPYPNLDNRIATTYAAKSTATLKNSLYDSYVKAFRWASDRLDQNYGGVIAFVSNAGWLDGNAMDGMRKCLAAEFNKIFVFNLRGNQRTSGELSIKVGGKIFGSGSRTPIAITVLVKKPETNGPVEIYHHDIGDYLSREEKLAKIMDKHDIYNPEFFWERIIPNEDGDWLNKRSVGFEKLILLGGKVNKNIENTFFKPIYSNGLKTNRDPWCYNYSNHSLETNIKSSIEFYNSQAIKIDKLKSEDKEIDIKIDLIYEPTKFSWDYQQKIDVIKSKKYYFSDKSCYIGLYRPFSKQNIYFDRSLNNRVYLLPDLFPTKNHQNLVICIPGPGGTQELMPLISQNIPDLHLNGDSQCFPRYYYEIDSKKQNTLFKSNNSFEGYTRHDAITDYIFGESKSKYGPKVTKEDIFYYVYGLLHSEDYRVTFSADLKKMMPRLPLVDKAEDFWAFSKAGRDLADLHLNYESVKPYPKVTVTGADKGNFIVDKMRFAHKKDKSVIYYNHAITIS
ncbi:MAG: N-6 DNA methylase, partial [Deltaproteobacteria bacterium]|nr:N-6 DNA methylase [Deltaproteobacteria bacterium]